MYDVIIIGGGPAAVAASVYCARKQLKSLLIAKEFGGQSIVSDDIQNWIGDEHIAGVDLAKRFEKHAKAYPEVLEVKEGEEATKIESVSCNEDRVCDFAVTTNKATYHAKSLIVCSGARRRKLGVPGETEFNGKGVAYCSTCDAPLFKDMQVAVVGSGNAGLEAVQDLLPYASKISLLVRADKVTGDAVTFEKISKEEKVEVIYEVQAKEIRGDKMVNGLVYEDLTGGPDKTIEVKGVFIEIGSVPNSEIAKELVDIDRFGQIIIDAKYASTSHPGIFAAGDVTDDPYKQNNISAGDGVRAALSAYSYVLKRQKANPTHEQGE